MLNIPADDFARFLKFITENYEFSIVFDILHPVVIGMA